MIDESKNVDCFIYSGVEHIPCTHQEETSDVALRKSLRACGPAWASAAREHPGRRQKTGHDGDKDHVVVKPDDVKWGPGPPELPRGAQLAVLVGDPGKAVPFVIRAKLPDGYKIPTH